MGLLGEADKEIRRQEKEIMELRAIGVNLRSKLLDFNKSKKIRATRSSGTEAVKRSKDWIRPIESGETALKLLFGEFLIRESEWESNEEEIKRLKNRNERLESRIELAIKRRENRLKVRLERRYSPVIATPR